MCTVLMHLYVMPHALLIYWPRGQMTDVHDVIGVVGVDSNIYSSVNSWSKLPQAS